MMELKGKYNDAKVFTYNVEATAISQIINLLNQEFITDSKIRIMPDVHAGAGCTIGTTMTITDKIVPNLVGVDIGCGMKVAVLKETKINLEAFDKHIKQNVPAGFSIRQKAHKYVEQIHIDELRCAKHVKLDRAELSIGTLGGGNHFIEVDKDSDGVLYLVVHTGSRNLGKQIAEWYQKLASEPHREKGKTLSWVDKNLAYLEGELFNDYLHDMNIAQHYANYNRLAIIETILSKTGLTAVEGFETIHNYIDMENKILRKGAISAQKGEKCLIPLNMRDGSLICIGKGNEDWNYSAPHGAGRLMSRAAAKESITLTQYKEAMEGIYSSTINKSTIDEAPFAYKPIEDIIDNIGDTVEIVKQIKPIYNFKAAE